MNKRIAAVVVMFLLLVVAAVALGTWTSESRPEQSALAPVRPAKPPPLDIRTPAAPTASAIAGSVATVANGRGLAGAVVSLTTLDGAPVMLRPEGHATGIAAVRTDVDGRFAFDTVPAGRYVATATAAGHRPGRIAIDGPDDELRIVLTPGGSTLAGAVTDVGGGPIEDAVISVRSGHAVAATTLTNADGRYALAVEDGAHRVTVWDPDYQSKRKDVRVRGRDRTLDFALVPGAAIFGTVVDRHSGAPVAGARVRFALDQTHLGGPARSSDDDESTTSDAAGRFSLRRLGAGRYEVMATASHRASRSTTALSLAVAEQRTDLVVFVDPAHDVHGRVVDARQPSLGVAGVEIFASPEATAPAVLARSQEDGSFVLEGVTEGEHMLQLRGAGVVETVQDTLAVGADDVDGWVVQVVRGTEVRGTVSPAGVVTVGLRARGPGIELGGRYAQPSTVATTSANDDGAFTLTGVPEGDWVIFAEGPEGAYAERGIAVARQGERGVRLELAERAEVTGTVVDREGRPVVDARVEIESNDRPHLFAADRTSALTDADGAFTLVGVPDGVHRVSARDEHGAHMRCLAGPGDGRGLSVEVHDARAHALRLEVERPTGVIEGTVIGTDGGPHPDAWLTLWPDADDGLATERPRALTDADGAFAFTQLAEGSYSLVAASREGDARLRVEHRVPEDGHRRLVLQPLAALEGHVTASGRPVATFEVDGSLLEPRAVIDPDGRFALDDLSPGTTDVRIRAADRTHTVDVQLIGGQTTTVDIELDVGEPAEASDAP